MATLRDRRYCQSSWMTTGAPTGLDYSSVCISSPIKTEVLIASPIKTGVLIASPIKTEVLIASEIPKGC